MSASPQAMESFDATTLVLPTEIDTETLTNEEVALQIHQDYLLIRKSMWEKITSMAPGTIPKHVPETKAPHLTRAELVDYSGL